MDNRKLESVVIKQNGKTARLVASVKHLTDALRSSKQRCQKLSQENAILETKLKIALAGEEFDTKMSEKLDFLFGKFEAAMLAQQEAEAAESNEGVEEDWVILS